MLRLSLAGGALVTRHLSSTRPAPPHCCFPPSRGRQAMATVGDDAAGAMLGCTVYVSEGRDAALIGDLAALAAGNTQVALVNQFVDVPYHRTSFTLASPYPQPLAEVAARITKTALSRLDLTAHQATHPRLGSVDHISCHPLGPAASLEGAAALARSIGDNVGREPSAAPVFLYGAAESSGRQLHELRRAFGYFRGSSEGRWQGAIQPADGLTPDYGPGAVDARVGIVAVGATQWVVNFNVLLDSSDMAMGRRIAKAVSERGGGLPAVACNLLDSRTSGPAAVLDRVAQLAAEGGVQVHSSYEIGKPLDTMVSVAAAQLGAG
eukprot:jgi/Tetstr1/429279/TSEL_019197.t1